MGHPLPQRENRGSNTLLTAEGVVEVDFDIALQGPTAKEFELGKLLYHLLFYASDREQKLAYLQVFGVRKTVVIDILHESTILPVSQEHAEELISMLQAVQGN